LVSNGDDPKDQASGDDAEAVKAMLRKLKVRKRPSSD
jgi:hypothetical protein